MAQERSEQKPGLDEFQRLDGMIRYGDICMRFNYLAALATQGKPLNQVV